MSFNVKTSSIRTIRPGDVGWEIRNDFVVAPRAGFEVSDKCPREYRMIIQECINYGWIKPVANATEQELLMFTLGSQ